MCDAIQSSSRGLDSANVGRATIRQLYSGARCLMDAFLTSNGLLALVTLTVLEIVLGVDNVIFISILSAKLPAHDRPRARRAGLLGAMLMRIALLLSIAWVVRLTAPLFSILGRDISGRDLILIGGGLFLLAKATLEIHERLEGEEHERAA